MQNLNLAPVALKCIKLHFSSYYLHQGGLDKNSPDESPRLLEGWSMAMGHFVDF